jgi:hypothetical protein
MFRAAEFGRSRKVELAGACARLQSPRVANQENFPMWWAQKRGLAPQPAEWVEVSIHPARLQLREANSPRFVRLSAATRAASAARPRAACCVIAAQSRSGTSRLELVSTRSNRLVLQEEHGDEHGMNTDFGNCFAKHSKHPCSSRAHPCSSSSSLAASEQASI